ncbi:unnamed protein product [Rhizoctonia solani]|uniref:Uncharacterized protein n=1 Tax=Rhizoctonia solani TaxID=456999 RepID=A0A8H3ATL7_9AGAM|nr:unnamed protein product [Rhizoctonia solani]
MMISDRDDRKIGLNSPLVPPQLPPFLASVFKLKPILGHPSREEVKLVHEAIRALNNFMHNLPAELSQYLFDIQMVCYRQKYPINVLPNEAIYEPPSLPGHIPVELKSITGAPSNKEITFIHTALRITESFSNVPSLFDPDLHAQISQHLFDVQLVVEIRDIKDSLKQLNRIMVGTQNSLARGFNSSRKYGYKSISHNIGAHSLINDYGEVPETHHLPTFKNGEYGVHFSLDELDGGVLARYLRFYGLGEELIEEGEELKIKDDMVGNAKELLSERLFLNR